MPITVTWADAEAQARLLAERHDTADLTGVWGVPRGGVPVALMVGRLLGVPVLDEPQPGALIVDDLIDSGSTAQRVKRDDCILDALYRKPWSPAHIAPGATTVDDWLVFPWESNDGDITDAITRLIQYIGEDPTREGLLETPKRVAKAFRELTDGYGQDTSAILAKTFDIGLTGDAQMIHVDNIEFVSMCEHHMLPFTGIAHVAYIPTSRVVGLSKIPRTVQAFARRLQVQERLTQQIADAIENALQPKGVGVSITAHHSCMGLRGAKQPNATMTTTALRGLIHTNPATQAEFVHHTQALRHG